MTQSMHPISRSHKGFSAIASEDYRILNDFTAPLEQTQIRKPSSMIIHTPIFNFE